MNLSHSHPAPADWDQRRRAKALLRRCREFGLEESARRQALCVFGRHVENLSLSQVEKLEQTYFTMIAALESQIIEERRTH